MRLFCLLLCLSVFALAQTKPREIKITLTDGATISGSLMKMEADALQIKSAIGETKIDLDKVVKIEFLRVTNEPSKTEALALIKDIRGLVIAAPNLSLVEYSKRIGDLKVREDDVQKGPLGKVVKEKISLAIGYHDLALRTASSRYAADPKMRGFLSSSWEWVIKMAGEAEALLSAK